MMKRSLGQQIFFAIFGTFERYVTNLRGTFDQNVKKVQNQPTLMNSTGTYCIFATFHSQSTPDFSMTRCSGTVYLAIH
jgi:hypothetical protein